MHPILFELGAGQFKIHSYGVVIFAACMSALWITVWRARREGIDPNAVYELAIWLFLGGAIGARALFVAFYPETIHSIADVFRSWAGGNVFYGCILGGLTGSLIYWYRRPYPFWTMADAAAPGVAIGAGVGRIGCFLNGCCFGAPTSHPLAVQYAPDSIPWHSQLESGLISVSTPMSLPVHPTQIYAAIAGFLVLAFLLAYIPYRRRHGELIALLMISYGLSRWPIEMMRGDERPILAGMTLSQTISAILIAAGTGLWLARRASRTQPALRGSHQRMAIRATVPDCPISR